MIEIELLVTAGDDAYIRGINCYRMPVAGDQIAGPGIYATVLTVHHRYDQDGMARTPLVTLTSRVGGGGADQLIANRWSKAPDIVGEMLADALDRPEPEVSR